MKVLAVLAAVVAALVVSGCADVAVCQTINQSVVRSDARGLWITNTFPVGEGARVKDYVYTTARNDTLITINPTSPTPGYLILTIPAESALTKVWVQFYEVVQAFDPPLTYALGDTIPVYVGGVYRQEIFNNGLWDYVKVWPVGSAGGKCDIYWRTECYGN